MSRVAAAAIKIGICMHGTGSIKLQATRALIDSDKPATCMSSIHQSIDRDCVQEEEIDG